MSRQFRISLRTLSATAAAALLAACQQPKPPSSPEHELNSQPPSGGIETCPAAAADWLDAMPAQQRRILPEDCSQLTSVNLFSWGDARDRLPSTTWTFTLRQQGGSVLVSRTNIAEPRLILNQTLASGDYEWSVSYTSSRGVAVSTKWRRFNIAAVAARTMMAASTQSSAVGIPDGQTIATNIIGKARPRMLPAGSSYASIAAAAQTRDFLPVLNGLRATAKFALSQAVPAAPSTPSTAAELAKVQDDRVIRQTARAERLYIEALSVVGRLDNNTSMLAAAKQRLIALASWNPKGSSSETSNDQANREIHLALATGLDIFWSELSSTERNVITAALRDRLIQATTALSVLDRDPYDSHGTSNVRWANQSLLLAAGLPGFPEAQGLLAKCWDLSRFTLSTWGDKDGSFGNGIAYGWYAFVSTVPYVAAVRTIAGVDLYQLDYLRRAGEQLVAFTAPNRKQPSAYGDETETTELYAYYASNYYRLHAQLTRDPVDAWYWQVNPNNFSNPNEPLALQLLLLGTNASALPAAKAPTQHNWFSDDAGLAAMHVDITQSARTSLFFRASRFGAFNHSHADQNSIVYVSQGQPLLIGAGYYPYYNSPHHRSVTRATRFKNALSFDGGYGQSESVYNASQPSDPAHSMDASGKLLRAETRGNLAIVSGDATAAYRAINASTGMWVPLLSNAVRSVVMDKANGLSFVYDWATSATARRWELNYHSPNAFSADASTVKASNGGASVCLDRYGPGSSFSQTMAWPVAPEVTQPAQAHGRFTMLTPSTELAHLTVLRDGCKIQGVQVQQTGTRIQVQWSGQTLVFDKRAIQTSP